MSSLRLLSPVGISQLRDVALAPGRRDLKGLRLGILDNGKPNADVVLDQAATYLEEKFGLIRSVTRRKTNAALATEFIDEFAEQCDVAVVGVGD
ncbi:MAG: hypothetical protein HY675_15760 [Chloroflexi bacterium]|nr:hypothetical protein [Chloroflexota bacterium]